MMMFWVCTNIGNIIIYWQKFTIFAAGMKRLSIILLGILAAASAFAQQTHIDSIWVDTRATFHQQTTDGVYSSNFQGDYFNIHMSGQLSDNLTFRIRQRMNKGIIQDNPFNATDFLWLKWQATNKWSFTFGKHPIMVGGYEVDSAPIDVYYYGAFTNRFYQYYAFGVSATFEPVAGQAVSVQFCPSPISLGTQDSYSYNLYWNGQIFSHWKTIWSYNLVEDELHRKMNWVVLGNKFPMGPLVVDFDFVDRFAFTQTNPLSDWSLILKAILTLGNWNICTKVGYERNDASNIDPHWNHEWDTLVPASHIGSYDLVLPAGNDYLYYGAGLEYFPLGNDRLRLHFAYFADNHDRINNFDLGVTWRFRIYSWK